MSTVRETLKNAIPDSLKPAARRWYDGLRRLPELPEAFFHPWRVESIHRLRKYKDIHRGERCFIIGNGPSLKQLDLTLLKNEYTFGMNRIYMAFEEMGFSTSYYVCMNDLVVEQCAEDIQKLDIPRFLSWRARKWVHLDEGIQYHLFHLYRSAFLDGYDRQGVGKRDSHLCGSSTGILYGI